LTLHRAAFAESLFTKWATPSVTLDEHFARVPPTLAISVVPRSDGGELLRLIGLPAGFLPTCILVLTIYIHAVHAGSTMEFFIMAAWE
jgi:sulfite exporter TauE/SafE